VTAIWGFDQGGVWRPLVPAAYPAEAALHDLVQRAPQMLPLAGFPRLTVLGREVRLGGGMRTCSRWSHLGGWWSSR
jgi:hypothetical protein